MIRNTLTYIRYTNKNTILFDIKLNIPIYIYSNVKYLFRSYQVVRQDTFTGIQRLVCNNCIKFTYIRIYIYIYIYIYIFKLVYLFFFFHFLLFLILSLSYYCIIILLEGTLVVSIDYKITLVFSFERNCIYCIILYFYSINHGLCICIFNIQFNTYVYIYILYVTVCVG